MQTTIIYGAGGLGRTLLLHIEADITAAKKQTNIVFADGNQSLWGTLISGYRVINPSDIPSIDYNRIIVATAQGLEAVNEKLTKELGVPVNKIDASYVQYIYDRTFEIRNRFIAQFAEVANAYGIQGNCAEGGVFEGYFAKRINAAFPDRTLYLFDTFEGFDKRDIAHESGFTTTRVGDFNLKVTQEFVKSQMPYPESVIIRKGYFPETAEGIGGTFVFVNLDFDLYAPTLAGLEFFYPKMTKGGVILIHDYFCNFIEKSLAFDRVRLAVDEFCSKYDVNVIPIGDEMSIAIVK